MSTTLTPLAQKRADGIARYDAAVAALAEAQASGDRDAVNRASGALGGPKIAIRNAELKMALADEPFKPWIQPAIARKRSGGRSASQIRQEVKTLTALAATTPYPTVKRSAEQQIEALKKALAKAS